MFLEKSFELWLCNTSNAMVAKLVLSQLKINGAKKKQSGKRNIIYLSFSWYLEIILILLTKIIIVYIRFFQVYFQRFIFKKILLGTRLYLDAF